MNTYISILRGINVSGKNIIKMADLRLQLEFLGFDGVITYIQSGNIVFKSEEQNSDKLQTVIRNHIKSKYGFIIPVLVLKPEYIKSIIDTLPFTDIDPTKLHVTFLSTKCSNPPIDQIMDKKNGSELVHITEDAVYIYCPDGYGKTKLNNNFLEKKLNVTATTRNWKTVNKLLELIT